MAIACHHIIYCVLAKNGEEPDMKGMGGGGGGGGEPPKPPSVSVPAGRHTMNTTE